MSTLKIISIFVFIGGVSLILLGVLYNPQSINDILGAGQIKDYEFNMKRGEVVSMEISGSDYFTFYIMNDTSFKSAGNFSSSLYTDTVKSTHIKFTAPAEGKYHLVIANVNSRGAVAISISYGKRNLEVLSFVGIAICVISIALPVYDHHLEERKRVLDSMCPQCGRYVSSSWNYCPRCRYPLQENRFFIKSLALVIFLILLASFSTSANAQETRGITILHWSFENESYEAQIILKKGIEHPVVNYHNHTILLDVPEKEYLFYHRYPGGYRFSIDTSYLKYFLTTYDNATRLLAIQLHQISLMRGFDSLTELNFILTFIHSLAYKDDFVDTGYVDYYKFPLETLVDGGGDCEDLSILLATMTHILGYYVVLLVMNITTVLQNEKMGHVAVGVNIVKEGSYGKYLRDYYIYNGKKYYYMETTASESQTLSGGVIHYYVGISPEETDYYKIDDLRFVSFSNYVYRGYSSNFGYVEKSNTHNDISIIPYVVAILLLGVVYMVILITTLSTERRKCPICGYPLEEDYNYCPNCGYILKIPLPFEDFHKEISSTDDAYGKISDNFLR